MIQMKKATLGLVAAMTAVSGLAAAAPASAAALPQSRVEAATNVDLGTTWNGWDDRRYRDDRRGWSGRRYDDRRYDDRRDWRGDRGYWRGNDGRYYCRRSDGTTGLLIGGAAGALLGREVAGRGGDRTLGAVLGAAGGALLGREVDRGGGRCR